MIRTPDLLAHRPFDFTTGLGEPSEEYYKLLNQVAALRPQGLPHNNFFPRNSLTTPNPCEVETLQGRLTCSSKTYPIPQTPRNSQSTPHMCGVETSQGRLTCSNAEPSSVEGGRQEECEVQQHT